MFQILQINSQSFVWGQFLVYFKMFNLAKMFSIGHTKLIQTKIKFNQF
jgi:hypothetical protein